MRSRFTCCSINLARALVMGPILISSVEFFFAATGVSSLSCGEGVIVGMSSSRAAEKLAISCRGSKRARARAGAARARSSRTSSPTQIRLGTAMQIAQQVSREAARGRLGLELGQQKLVIKDAIRCRTLTQKQTDTKMKRNLDSYGNRSDQRRRTQTDQQLEPIYDAI